MRFTFWTLAASYAATANLTNAVNISDKDAKIAIDSFDGFDFGQIYAQPLSTEDGDTNETNERLSAIEL